MPRVNQPTSLYEISLPITALRIRTQCEAILPFHKNDVTSSGFKASLTSFNDHLMSEVPQHVLYRISNQKNLSGFIYFGATALKIQDKTLRNTSMHQHLVVNVCPSLNHLISLNLSKVEGSKDLFTSVSINCLHLEEIFVNTDMDFVWEDADIWTNWILLLINCKKLQYIYDEPYSHFWKIKPMDIAILIKELPNLKVINSYDVAAALSLDVMRSGVYQLTSINGVIRTGEDVHWLNEHCPFVTHIMWSPTYGNSPHDDVFSALNESDFEIKSLAFSPKYPMFREGMNTFFVNKGRYLQSLTLSYYSVFHAIPLISLSFDDFVFISDYCHILKSLTLNGNWYRGEALNSSQSKTHGLFSNLEYFRYDHYHNPLIIPHLLTELTNLKILHCRVKHDETQVFLRTFETNLSKLPHLTTMELRTNKYQNETQSLEFLKITLSKAIEMPNIRNIVISFTFSKISSEACEYVENIKKYIQFNNLDLIIVVNDKTGCR